MNLKRKISALVAVSLGLGLPGISHACGAPSERWYMDISDVVFDASALCDQEQRSCQLRVSRIQKNPQHLDIERRSIEVDFQDWYADWYEANPDSIILVCGVPYFEPEQVRFRARFYANLDEETSELIIRRAKIRSRGIIPQE